MKNILVPTDFSTQAGYAFDLALQLAKKSGGKVHVINIVEVPISAVADPMGAPIVADWGADFLKTITKDHQIRLEKLVSESESRVEILIKTEVGVVLDSTLDYISENSIDLVVMGTKGATGLKEIFIGSNAEKVVRFSPCPVITVRYPAVINEIENIVFGLDLSGSEEKVISQLKTLQKVLNVTIHFIYVDTPHVIINHDEMIGKLRSFALENEFEDYTVNIRKNIQPDSGIIEFAKELSADMIAMSTHSRKGLSHFISGSLAEDVVNHSPLPVWTISLKRDD
ncbi:MAG: universal stress protein [Bacteroidetes bacterium]|nr:universal stress protein [Bacteroidota bacterium]MDA1119084.1 universal stress protein [Bacteroidota bacterium]